MFTITAANAAIPRDTHVDSIADMSDKPLFAEMLVSIDADHIAVSDINGDTSIDGLDSQPLLSALIPW